MPSLCSARLWLAVAPETTCAVTDWMPLAAVVTPNAPLIAPMLSVADVAVAGLEDEVSRTLTVALLPTKPGRVV